MSEWISVKDRLPDEHESVLISRNNIPKWVPPMIAFCLNGEFFQDVMEPPLKATHWMPLPEPPPEK